MFKHAPLFVLLLVAAGCARDDSSSVATGPEGRAALPASATVAGRLTSPVASAVQATVGAGHAFASLPDRGNLVGYPARPVVRRDGAYTWHRAELSEQHAIRAIATGVMRIKAPSGEELDFQYDRHEEYPNGDWTWVGHLVHGSQADDVVITFGPKAAFGTIAQPAGKAPLRLTIQNGVSWLVETDQAAIAAVRNAATDPKRPDYLVPPKAAAPVHARTGGSTGTTASAAPVMAAATAAGNPVVDLVIGYTPGFASGLGGDSQAQTRLNNMVAITNEAYANSQVPGRVRLVKTVLVNYPDATSNDTALEQLTGFKAPSTRTTPAAAFSALRAARDQYGADLVSLVRKFNDPENDGCGIAWLIGGSSSGNGSIHSSDEFFGYSVVSDGFDGNYSCRDETLAHELGHNMGAQHDRVTATEGGKVSYGVYPYSFGYKVGSADDGFYTIMAYGDSGQSGYRTFSNPMTMFCGGRPCGTTNQADVARSLMQTMPVVAAFRSTAVPLRFRPVQNDVDGDGRSDLFWVHPEGVMAYWRLNANAVLGARAFSLPQGSRIETSGDYNGDGVVDLVVSDGRNMTMWLGNGSDFPGYGLGYYADGWKILASGDVDGDGRSDVVWFHPVAGLISIWFLDANRIIRAQSFSVPAGFAPRFVADYGGDGLADLLLSDGRNLILWERSKDGFVSRDMGYYDAGWVIAGGADVDGNGSADLIWHNPGLSLVSVWLTERGAVSGSFSVGLPAGYVPRVFGDFNGDRLADIIIDDGRNMLMWLGDGRGFPGYGFGYYADGWRPQYFR